LTIGSTTSTKDEKSQGKPKREIDTHSIISLAGNKESMGKPKTFSKKKFRKFPKKMDCDFLQNFYAPQKGPSFRRFTLGGVPLAVLILPRPVPVRSSYGL